LVGNGGGGTIGLALPLALILTPSGGGGGGDGFFVTQRAGLIAQSRSATKQIIEWLHNRLVLLKFTLLLTCFYETPKLRKLSRSPGHPKAPELSGPKAKYVSRSKSLRNNCKN
jgi:hypothetical protein